MSAIWAITPNGAILAKHIAKSLPESELFFSESLGIPDIPHRTFRRLSDAVSESFACFDSHIFIMSVGIVVRLIAPHLRHKTMDPAVVVVDDAGQHAISLLSGHIGGANALAAKVAERIGARPVITTATDVNQVPAIDMIAKEKGLHIENPEAIKHVNMAILTGKPIHIHDPFGFLKKFSLLTSHFSLLTDNPGVFIDDITLDLPPQVLILRPPSMFAGIGCNRNTVMTEIKDLLCDVFGKSGLSLHSLAGIASIDIKKDEAGLLELAEDLKLPSYFFTKQELETISDIPTPSEMVRKHIGVRSVCEAAAILASRHGKLIVTKHSTRNVTVAVARKNIPY